MASLCTVVDKLATMPRSKPGERIGEVCGTDMLALSRALVVFLGFARPASATRSLE